ncbi:MAG: YoaK family protein [Chthoniobacterales bacterium]
MQTGLGDSAFGTSLGLAFVGGYADASSFLTVSTFTGHLTGNCVLAAVSVATKEWYVAMDRLLAVAAFLGGILASLTLSRFLPVYTRRYSLPLTMFIELVLVGAAFVFLWNHANNELFILCMCLALGMQNDALRNTHRVSVHSTYMTGMVTSLVQKGFAYFLSERNAESRSSTDSASTAIRILAPMWMSFILGAVGGAVMVARFHALGLLGMVPLLLVLICAEIKVKLATGG